jgi:hypothetical protein
VPEDINIVNPGELVNQAFVKNKFGSATLYDEIELPAIASAAQQIPTKNFTAYVES